MISEDTDSQDDTETDHAYNQSSDQEEIMDILCQDLDSDEDDSLFGTEQLESVGATDRIVSNMQSMKGKLATFMFKLFNTEPVSALFDTGATCSCILAYLYNKISKKVAMTKKPKGLVRLLIKINDNHFEHMFIVCQNLKQPLLF